MYEDFIKHKDLVIVALSVSVIGTAGVSVYHHYLAERRRSLLQKEIAELKCCVKDIRKDLDTVKLALGRNIVMSQRNTRPVTGAPSVTTDAETEMFSTVDEFCDEFYELSSDNDNVAEEINGLSFEEMDVLLDGNSKEDKIKVYGILLEMMEKGDKNDEVLWRLSKACHMLSSTYGAEGDEEKKKEFILKGADFGEQAVVFNESNWRAHKWFAICVGKRGQLKGVKEKLRDGNLFKEHIDKAIAINPDDALLHHLLGRFYYEIASLSWLERKVANTLFGKVPEGSYKDALNSLLVAEKLFSTPWMDNRLLIAKCHAALQDIAQAVHWLDLAKKVPVDSDEVRITEKEVDELLKKFNPYKAKRT